MDEKNELPHILTLKEAKDQAKRVALLTANRWKHRRRMAYISLFSILVVTYWCIFEVETERLKELDEIVTWFYLTLGSIIGAYVGFATLDDKWKEAGKKEE